VRDPIRAVLIDLGDTLVHLNRPWEDVFEANVRSFYEYMRVAAVKADFDKFSAAFVRAFEDASSKSDLYKIEIPMQEIISRVMGKFGVRNPYQGFLQGAMEAYYRPELQTWEAFPDAIEALNNLEKSGYALGLISNAKSDWAVHAIMRKNEIEKFFKVIVTSAALRIRKPRPEIFIKTLDALGVRPREATFVGDSLDADVIGARNVGMHVIYLRRKPPAIGDNRSFLWPCRMGQPWPASLD
jgi:2-haloalkanoic acid dehalogenase type II